MDERIHERIYDLQNQSSALMREMIALDTCDPEYKQMYKRLIALHRALFLEEGLSEEEIEQLYIESKEVTQ